MIGSAPDWPTVDPEVVRTKADVRTWADLDYLIVARASMLHIQVAWSASEARRAMALS